MNSLFIVRETDHAWLREQFRGRHPLLVTLCNKPFIEFLIDFSILAGARAIRIVSDGPIAELEQYCGNGSRWGIEMSYAHMLPEDGRTRILEKNRRFCSSGRMMIVDGVLFIDNDKTANYRAWFAAIPAGEVIRGDTGSITITGEPLPEAVVPPRPRLGIPPVSSISHYFALSAETLRAGDRYILPGYSNEQDCFIGRNVVIQKGAEIRKPVMIGNNVQIMSGSVIGPGTIIGNNVIVDRESTVSESILMDNTFVGEQLEVERKIAEGNLLIGPESGASLLMEDPHLMGTIRQPAPGNRIVRYLVHAIAAAILIILLAIPFLVLRPLLALQKNWKTVAHSYPASTPGKTMVLKTAKISPDGLTGRIAIALALDRFALLFKVLEGSLLLIGHRPQSSSATAGVDRNPVAFNPAVFGYSEAEDWAQNDVDTMIIDHYYALHGSPMKDISLVLNALTNRKTV